jgi:pimeloyl-ACP methyl ester carboxylesterase
MGGAIAQEWALARPDEVRGLVLFNTWARTDSYMRLLLEHWTALSREGSDERLLESLMLFCLSPGYLNENPHVAAEFLAEPSPAGEGFELQAAACLGHDILPRETIEAPTLIIGGRNDGVIRVERIEELADAIPGAELHLLDTGHVAFWEQPADSIALLRDFVAGVE